MYVGMHVCILLLTNMTVCHRRSLEACAGFAGVAGKRHRILGLVVILRPFVGIGRWAIGKSHWPAVYSIPSTVRLNILQPNMPGRWHMNLVPMANEW